MFPTMVLTSTIKLMLEKVPLILKPGVQHGVNGASSDLMTRSVNGHALRAVVETGVY